MTIGYDIKANTIVERSIKLPHSIAELYFLVVQAVYNLL